MAGWCILLFGYVSLTMCVAGCETSEPLLPPCPSTTSYYLCTWPPETATQATCEDDSKVLAVPVVGTCEPKPNVECVKACPDGRTTNP
jgi:hypothetical protein